MVISSITIYYLYITIIYILYQFVSTVAHLLKRHSKFDAVYTVCTVRMLNYRVLSLKMPIAVCATAVIRLRKLCMHTCRTLPYVFKSSISFQRLTKGCRLCRRWYILNQISIEKRSEWWWRYESSERPEPMKWLLAGFPGHRRQSLKIQPFVVCIIGQTSETTFELHLLNVASNAKQSVPLCESHVLRASTMSHKRPCISQRHNSRLRQRCISAERKF